ncbi:hypothetical protein E2562_002069 [Oryza meyeriana var. granulata]|uniref:Uncharacterized protein n=1 Tax=Oryza meyeriana var. granulata TaxID=110450 RepID=A0A6G1EDK2_9ORYZ|nr:hypothetical protein E2562_002069 [Oryza meyeriana var. granulata]
MVVLQDCARAALPAANVPVSISCDPFTNLAPEIREADVRDECPFCQEICNCNSWKLSAKPGRPKLLLATTELFLLDPLGALHRGHTCEEDASSGGGLPPAFARACY